MRFFLKKKILFKSYMITLGAFLLRAEAPCFPNLGSCFQPFRLVSLNSLIFFLTVTQSSLHLFVSPSCRFPHSLMLGPSGMHPTGIPHPAIVPPTGKQEHEQYDRGMYV